MDDYYRMIKDPGRRWFGWFVMVGTLPHGFYWTRTGAQRALDRLVTEDELGAMD